MKLKAEKFIEEDSSITLSLHELDLIETEETEEAAVLALAQSILSMPKNSIENLICGLLPQIERSKYYTLLKP